MHALNAALEQDLAFAAIVHVFNEVLKDRGNLLIAELRGNNLHAGGAVQIGSALDGRQSDDFGVGDILLQADGQRLAPQAAPVREAADGTGVPLITAGAGGVGDGFLVDQAGGVSILQVLQGGQHVILCHAVDPLAVNFHIVSGCALVELRQCLGALQAGGRVRCGALRDLVLKAGQHLDELVIGGGHVHAEAVQPVLADIGHDSGRRLAGDAVNLAVDGQGIPQVLVDLVIQAALVDEVGQVGDSALRGVVAQRLAVQVKGIGNRVRSVGQLELLGVLVIVDEVQLQVDAGLGVEVGDPLLGAIFLVHAVMDPPDELVGLLRVLVEGSGVGSRLLGRCSGGIGRRRGSRRAAGAAAGGQQGGCAGRGQQHGNLFFHGFLLRLI